MTTHLDYAQISGIHDGLKRNPTGQAVRSRQVDDLDDGIDCMKAILDAGVLSVTIVMMMTVGMGLEARHFNEVVRRRDLLICLVVVPGVVLPSIGLLLNRVLSLSPPLCAGLLLIAACPVGDIANFFIYLARGNTALSVTVNILSCLICAASMCVTFQAYDRLLASPFEFAVPTPALVARVTLIAALPIIAGISLRRLAPRWVERSATTLRNISLAGVGVLLLYIFAAQGPRLAAEWWQTAGASALFIVLAMLCGLLFGRLLRLNARDRFASGVLFAVRNVGLAMAIAITLLNRVEYAVFAAVYFVTEVPLLLGSVALYRWRCRRALATAPTVLAVQQNV